MPKCLNHVLTCRWYQATKSNNQAMAAKADSLKDEMDEALNKVEICKVDFVLNLSCNAQFAYRDTFNLMAVHSCQGLFIRFGSYLMNWLNKGSLVHTMHIIRTMLLKVIAWSSSNEKFMCKVKQRFVMFAMYGNTAYIFVSPYRTSSLQTCTTLLPKREIMHAIMSWWVHLRLV